MERRYFRTFDYAGRECLTPYYDIVEVENALAAKDARIAELERERDEHEARAREGWKNHADYAAALIVAERERDEARAVAVRTYKHLAPCGKAPKWLALHGEWVACDGTDASIYAALEREMGEGE